MISKGSSGFLWIPREPRVFLPERKYCTCIQSSEALYTMPDMLHTCEKSVCLWFDRRLHHCWFGSLRFHSSEHMQVSTSSICWFASLRFHSSKHMQVSTTSLVKVLASSIAFRGLL